MEKFDKIDVEKNYHSRIQALWSKAEGTGNSALNKIVKDRALFAQDTLYKGAIVFLGIGASWDSGKQDTVKQVDNVHYETQRGRKKYDYYTPMYAMAEDTCFTGEDGEGCFSNIDLTMLRETSQKTILPFYKTARDFMREQFLIALDMLQEAKPRVIIASNALVRKIIRKEKELASFQTEMATVFNNDIGTEIIREPKLLEGTPIFFSSMLSGAGALDNGSKDRLVWHIKFALKK
jgi:hypothetical protein